MSIINTSMLAAGGLTAAIVAGWQQVKSFAHYLTSFVLISAQLDESLMRPVRIHLKKNYRPLPSGLLVYVSRYLTFRHKKTTTIVPFRVSANTVIYFKGWRVLIMMLNSGGTMTLRSLRGAFDFDALISQALDEHEARCSQNTERLPSRFHVIRVVGSEKGYHSQNNHNRADVTSRDSPVEGGSDSVSNISLDLSVDASFKYERHEYTYDEDVDPFANLYFPATINRYIEQAQQWMKMGDWYLERHIPWRRGWLLYGPGGTGKSSLSKAVAQSLRVPIYQYYLATLSDQEFIREWDSMATPCVALFEDFDAIFNKRESLTEHKSLTFDCVLNQISGVGSTNGVFLIVTTNHLENIDPAMGVECGKDGISTRPGRIDSVIEVGKMTRDNRYKLARQILCDWPDEIETIVNKGEDVTPIQFQEMCIQRAFDRLSDSNHLKLVREA